MRISVIFLAPVSALAVALLVAGGTVAGTNPDVDEDGVTDLVDNCREASNSLLTPGVLVSQGDSDRDGFGNICDADYNNNGLVNGQDTSQFNDCFQQVGGAGDPSGLTTGIGIACENMDHNSNGLINGQDTALFNGLFQASGGVGNPGPSGLPCAYTFAGAPNLTGRNPCVYDVDGSGPL